MTHLDDWGVEVAHAGGDLRDDIKECCEVLRETGLWKEYDWFPDHRDSELAFNAATWQLLDYLGVL